MTFPNLSAAKVIHFDLETKDPHIKERGPGFPFKDGHVVGVAVGADGLPASYYPIAHEGYVNLDRALVLEWLQREVFDRDVIIVGHNVSYDYGWIRAEGVRLNGARLACTMLAAALLDEDRRHYSLDALGGDWLNERKHQSGIETYAREHKLDPKGDLWRMPPELVGPYAAQDADLTGKLYEYEIARIIFEGIQEVADLEFDLIPCVVEMRERGVRVDEDRIARADEDLRDLERQLLAEIKARWSMDVNAWSAASVAKLADSIGIPYPRTKTGKPSFKSAFLNACTHEAMQKVARIRKVSKTRGTFVAALQKFVFNGRIHPEWHQLRGDDNGTITGRFSCSGPNLQQIPYRDAQMARIIRGCFLPELGAQWCGNDYSQQEPRLTIHFANKYKLKGAADAVRRYKENPRTDYHQMVADMTLLKREAAKAINLGLAYGMGRKKLAVSLGVDLDRADEILGQYHERLPFLRRLTELCANHAEADGLLHTIAGRPCRFNLWEPTDNSYGDDRQAALPREAAEAAWPGKSLKRAYTYTAMNRKIQGSGADQTKMAMRALHREGILPAIQIHDELITFGDEILAQRTAAIMKEVLPLDVPVVVDTTIGNDWSEA